MKEGKAYLQYIKQDREPRERERERERESTSSKREQGRVYLYPLSLPQLSYSLLQYYSGRAPSEAGS